MNYTDYSQTIGSFVRSGDYPLEAEYIFTSVEELQQWCAENQRFLHDGLLKIVKDEENQILYWCYNKEFYPLCDLSTFTNLEKLQEFIGKAETITDWIKHVEEHLHKGLHDIQKELDLTQLSIGLNPSGTLDPICMNDTNYLIGARSIIGCLKVLDQAIVDQLNNLAIDSFVKETDYDPENEQLVLTFVTKKGEQIVKIDVHDLIEEWNVPSRTSQYPNGVVLTRDRSVSGTDVLSADIKLVEGDKTNILEKTSTGLLVRGTTDNITHNGENLNKVIDELKIPNQDDFLTLKEDDFSVKEMYIVDNSSNDIEIISREDVNSMISTLENKYDILINGLKEEIIKLKENLANVKIEKI